MTDSQKANLYNGFALACSIWFLFTGWIWTYFACLFISYPFAIIGFLLWRKGKQLEKKTINQIAGWLLLAGLLLSILALILLLLNN